MKRRRRDRKAKLVCGYRMDLFRRGDWVAEISSDLQTVSFHPLRPNDIIVYANPLSTPQDGV